MRAFVTDALLSEVVVRPLVFAAFAALAFVPLEAVFALRPSRYRDRAARTDVLTDLAFATLGAIVTRAILALGVGVTFDRLSDFALEPAWDRLGSPFVGRLTSISVGLLVFELAGYAYHRLAHAVPALYRLHSVHHSSTSMDFLAAFRQHPLELFALTTAQNVPLVLLGIPLGSHAIVVVFLAVMTVFVHANVRVPPSFLDRVVAMPAFHHRHHAREQETKNFASLFPFLDRLFGTHAEGDAVSLGTLAAEGATPFGGRPTAALVSARRTRARR